MPRLARRRIEEDEENAPPQQQQQQPEQAEDTAEGGGESGQREAVPMGIVPVNQPQARPYVSRKNKGKTRDGVEDEEEGENDPEAASSSSASASAADMGEEFPGRLMINRIILKNFKSYKGEVVVGPLHKSFQSIVGANGSGKSNLIDAVIFVFGFAAKKMRQEKLQELICQQAGKLSRGDRQMDCQAEAGRQARPLGVKKSKLQARQVSVCFGIEVKWVAAMKDAHSCKVTLEMKNILDTSTGEVEDIATKPPKKASDNEKDRDGFLELFEEIFGSDVFLPMLKEAEKKETDLKEVEEERLRTKDTLYKESFTSLSRLARFNILSALVKLLQSRAKEDEMKTKWKEDGKLVQELDRLTSEHETARKDLEGAEKAQEDAVELVKEAERKDSEIQTEMKNLEAQKQDLNKKISDKENQKLQTENDCKHHQHQKTDTQPKLEEANRTLKDERQKASQMEDELNQQLEPLRKKKRELEQPVKELTRNLAKIESDMNVSQGICKRAQEKMKQSQNEFAQAKERREDISERLEHLKENRRAKQEAITEASNHSNRLVAERKKLEEDKRNGMARMAGERERLMYLQNQINASRNAGRKDQAIQRARGAGKLRGLIGRLGDLGRIDDMYDVAISQNFGSALERYVVKTQQDANELTDFFRTEQLGWCSIVPLEKINPQKLLHEAKHSWEPSRANGLKRLFDLITVCPGVEMAEEVGAAFYHIVRNTVVARDLDEASRVDAVKPGNRFVTLDGNMKDGGKITGGGRADRVHKGAMKGSNPQGRAPVSEEEVQELRRRVTNFERHLEQMDAEAKDKESTQDALAKEIDRTEKELLQIERQGRDMQKMLSDREALAKKAEETFQQISADVTRRLEEEHKKQSSWETEKAEMQSQLQKHEEPLHALEREMAAVGGEERREQQMAVRAAEQAVATLKEKLKKAESDLVSKERKIKDLDRQQGELRDQTTAIEKEIEEKKKEKAGVEDAALETMLEAERKTEMREEYKKKVEDLQNEKDDMERKVREFEKKKELDEKELAKDKDEIQHKRAKIVKAQKEYEDAKTKYDDYAIYLEDRNKLQTDNAVVDDEFGDSDGEDGDLSEPEGGEDNEEGDAERDGGEREESEAMKKLRRRIKWRLEFVSERAVRNGWIDWTEEELQCLESCKRMRKFLSSKRSRVDFAINDSNQPAGRRQKNEDEAKNATKSYWDQREKRNQKFKEKEEAAKEYKAIKVEREKYSADRRERFENGFRIVQVELRNIYKQLTVGGTADLEYIDCADPFTEGIKLTVRPKDKSWQEIATCSGGEKTIASLSLIFALHKFKPTPIYFLDEIDAALDHTNVFTIAQYIRAQTSNGQFLIISLRNENFEMADSFVGVSKRNNETRVREYPFGGMNLGDALVMRQDKSDKRKAAHAGKSQGDQANKRRRQQGGVREASSDSEGEGSKENRRGQPARPQKFLPDGQQPLAVPSLRGRGRGRGGGGNQGKDTLPRAASPGSVAVGTERRNK
uniref:Structural maintenance of chromosomes protein n=1 Tax=Chromera velia CCMP2878 TaxID=1169474 RepID=A0A0G4I1K4_9ALVE|eukprot:Cvel_10182.t1-p1 / transcript=Cvel_10182.t1 / gene=Cvel_10182 / organism=Chromera_velia_CCMP2878 / gene_product=Structural maintenance of chromosomes protein 4, putative / transcript_product=Structural maintenance of chromosomes protein 4, putative / location=Cvel_scaffold608:35507-56264(-) / protein_length=1493 / sequence_SO=supercontig / SO=protein_coding / is_pseudo=false